jgi:hypothetical protein
VPDARELLLGVLLPVLAAALIALAGPRRAGVRTAALALGASYLAGHVGLRGWRGWVPHESSDWIPVCAALGLVMGLTGLSRVAALRWLAPAGLVWLMLGALLERELGLPAALGSAALLGLVSALAWWLLGREAEAEAGPVDLAGLTLIATAAAAAVGLSGSRLLGQLAGVLAAGLAGLTAVTLLRPCRGSSAGAVPVFVLTLGALVHAGALVSELPSVSAALLALTPLAWRLPRGGSASLRAGLVPLAVIALLGGAAAWIANAASPSWEGLY